MDSQMRDGAYFTNLLQSGVDTQQSPPEDQMEPIVKKTPRGGNFTVEEDILLVSAWLNISMDAVQGNEQKHKTYWIRIDEYFERERKSATRRTPNSLMNRWSLIQLGTNKFCGFLASIESKHQSGVTEQDKICQAKVMYQACNKTSFQLEHCWNILRHNPKWVSHAEKDKPKRRSAATSFPSTPESMNFGEEDDDSPTFFIDLERPIERKAEKERRNKRNNHDSMISNLEVVLDVMMERKKKKHDDKNEIFERAFSQTQELIEIKIKESEKAAIREEELIRLKQKEVELEETKQEMKIMAMDLTWLDLVQQEYFLQLRQEIMKRKKKSN